MTTTADDEKVVEREIPPDGVERKVFLAEIKADADQRGVIVGRVAGIGNLDRQGDIILPGAIGTKSSIPMLGHHDWEQGIGTASIHEEDKFVSLHGVLAVDDEDSATLRERALEYWAMAKREIVRGLSIGHIVGEYEFKERKLDNGRSRLVREIKKTDVVEASLVVVPANPRARITDVKSAENADDRSVDEVVHALVLQALVADDVKEALRELMASIVAEHAAKLEQIDVFLRKHFGPNVLNEKRMPDIGDLIAGRLFQVR